MSQPTQDSSLVTHDLQDTVQPPLCGGQAHSSLQAHLPSFVQTQPVEPGVSQSLSCVQPYCL